MRLDPETYWRALLAVAWADRSSRQASADADLVRASLSGPRDDLTGTLSDSESVRKAFDRLMQRADMASNWRAYNGGSKRLIFDRSPALRALEIEEGSDIRQAVADLAGARSRIEEELAIFDARRQNLSFLIMVSDLSAAGRAPAAWISRNRMQIAQAELFHRSATLRRIVSENLYDPISLVRALAAGRSAISAEAKRGYLKQSWRGEHAVATLTGAAIVSEPHLKDGHTARRYASAYDLYTRSPALRAIESSSLADDKSLFKFLLARRDRIAVECLKAMGKLDRSAYTFDGAERHYSLHGLVEALYVAGRIDRTTAMRLSRTAVGALEYYLERRDSMPELDRIARMNPKRIMQSDYDPARFTYLRDESKTLSDDNIKRVLRWAKWFYHDPGIVTRSIYGAKELPALTLKRRSMPPLQDLLPPHTRERVLTAASLAESDPIEARRRSFRALAEMVAANRTPEVRAQLSRDERRVVNLIDRLVRWNSDALETPAGSGGTTACVTSSPFLPPAMHPQAAFLAGSNFFAGGPAKPLI